MKSEGRQTRALVVPRVTVTRRLVVVNENDVDTVMVNELNRPKKKRFWRAPATPATPCLSASASPAARASSSCDDCSSAARRAVRSIDCSSAMALASNL